MGLLLSLAAIAIGIIVLVKISNNKAKFKGNSLAAGSIVLILAGLFFALFFLLPAKAARKSPETKHNTNESRALANTKTISKFIKTYISRSNGQYPVDQYELIYSGKSYLDDCYMTTTRILNNKTEQGYSYSLALNPQSYTITAKPQQCGVTGNTIFIDINGEISQKQCEGGVSQAQP